MASRQPDSESVLELLTGTRAARITAACVSGAAGATMLAKCETRKNKVFMANKLDEMGNDELLRRFHWYSSITFPLVSFIASTIIFSRLWLYGIAAMPALMISVWSVSNAYVDQLAIRMDEPKTVNEFHAFRCKLLEWNLWVRRIDHAFAYFFFVLLLSSVWVILYRGITASSACFLLITIISVFVIMIAITLRIQSRRCKKLGLICPSCLIPLVGSAAISVLKNGHCGRCDAKVIPIE